MNKKYHVERREFLNKFKDMRAYVMGIVENTLEHNVCCSDNKTSGQITLKIADCSDEIELWFDLSSAEKRENSLHKINVLAEVVSAVNEAIKLEVKAIEERETNKLHERAATAVH